MGRREPREVDLDNFEDEEHLRATWLAHREDVLAGFDDSTPWAEQVYGDGDRR